MPSWRIQGKQQTGINRPTLLTRSHKSCLSPW